jgi:hypothetical protein
MVINKGTNGGVVIDFCTIISNDLTEIINVVRIDAADVRDHLLIIDEAVVKCISWDLRYTNDLAEVIDG